MLSLNFSSLADGIAALQLTVAKTQPTAPDASEQPAAAEQLRKSVEVLLSAEAQKAAKGADKDADIDATDLPDRIKGQLKMIRSIQQRIAKRMQDMQAFMSDRSLSPKVRETKMRQLQLEISPMTNSLMQATGQLNQAMQQMQLSLADRALAGELVSPQNLRS